MQRAHAAAGSKIVVGGAPGVVFSGHAFYDPEDFEGVFESVLVNTLSEAELGEAGS